MLQYPAELTLDVFFNWTLPIIWNGVLFFGPFVLIPVGLILVARLFIVKPRTKQATLIATGVLGAGLLLATVALSLPK